MVVGIYIRVSTEEQANEGYSISAQRERLKAFCAAQNWSDFKFYVDEGISGRSTDRPQLQSLMSDIKAGHINILLVYRLDRLTRSVRDLHNLLDFLDKHNCVFKSATEIYDTSTAMGKMFITIIAAIAEWESANLGERVRMGQIEKARQGGWSAPVPYGWIKTNEDKLIVDDNRIQAVKLMVEKVREGYSFRQLSRYMNSTQYKPIRGYKWHIGTIKELLHNPILYGAMRWRDEIIESAHEGIMVKGEFEELQKIITSRQNFKKRHVTTHYVYQMKIVCPTCGNRCTSEKYVWKNKHKNSDEYNTKNRYRCQVCALNDRKPFSTSEEKLNEALMNYMNNFVLQQSSIIEPSTVCDGSDILKKEIQSIENQRERYQRAWAAGHMMDNEFAKLMNETKLRYDELQNELQSVTKKPTTVINMEQAIENAKLFNNSFQLLNQEEKRKFVQTFIERIEAIETTDGVRSKNIEITSVLFY